MIEVCGGIVSGDSVLMGCLDCCCSLSVWPIATSSASLCPRCPSPKRRAAPAPAPYAAAPVRRLASERCPRLQPPNNIVLPCPPRRRQPRLHAAAPAGVRSSPARAENSPSAQPPNLYPRAAAVKAFWLSHNAVQCQQMAKIHARPHRTLPREMVVNIARYSEQAYSPRTRMSAAG